MLTYIEDTFETPTQADVDSEMAGLGEPFNSQDTIESQLFDLRECFTFLATANAALSDAQKRKLVETKAASMPQVMDAIGHFNRENTTLALRSFEKLSTYLIRQAVDMTAVSAGYHGNVTTESLAAMINAAVEQRMSTQAPTQQGAHDTQSSKRKRDSSRRGDNKRETHSKGQEKEKDQSFCLLHGMCWHTSEECTLMDKHPDIFTPTVRREANARKRGARGKGHD